MATEATIGELNIVTDWSGNAACIIETTDISQLSFSEINERHALIEGEGDKSLNYWRQNHRLFFEKSSRRIGKAFSPDMPVIFEQFKVVFAA